MDDSAGQAALVKRGMRVATRGSGQRQLRLAAACSMGRKQDWQSKKRNAVWRCGVCGRTEVRSVAQRCGCILSRCADRQEQVELLDLDGPLLERCAVVRR